MAIKATNLLLFSFVLFGCLDDTHDSKTPTTDYSHHKVVTLQDQLPNGKMAPLLVVIPAGTNTLGDMAGTGLPIETPTYQVTIEKPFAIGKYEVTFDEYDYFCEQTGREKPDDKGWGRGRRPVINITYADTDAYVKWLRKITGKRYYLPSESQWEYATRAGSQTNYWWGDEPGDKLAQCAGCAAIHRCEDCKDVPLLDDGTVEVGSFNPNPFGLYDVHGNVMEWTADCSSKRHLAQPSDGSPRMFGDCSRHIMKDGSWWNNARFIRASVRGAAVDGWDYKSQHVGFRVARVINDKEKPNN